MSEICSTRSVKISKRGPVSITISKRTVCSLGKKRVELLSRSSWRAMKSRCATIEGITFSSSQSELLLVNFCIDRRISLLIKSSKSIAISAIRFAMALKRRMLRAKLVLSLFFSSLPQPCLSCSRTASGAAQTTRPTTARPPETSTSIRRRRTPGPMSEAKLTGERSKASITFIDDADACKAPPHLTSPPSQDGRKQIRGGMIEVIGWSRLMRATS